MVGSMIELSSRMVVVLPAPSGPTRPKISPSTTDRLRSATAVKSPNVLPSFRCGSFPCDGPYCHFARRLTPSSVGATAGLSSSA